MPPGRQPPEPLTDLAFELHKKTAIRRISWLNAADDLHAEELSAGEFRMKRRDAIIDELHRVRENIGKAHDFDVRRIAATVRQHETENPKGIIRKSPKQTTRQ